jgi:hydrogenase maturation factor
VKASQASQLVSALKNAGISDAAQIGEVFDGLGEKILIE